MKFLNSRTSSQTVHIPRLTGPLGLSMTQICVQATLSSVEFIYTRSVAFTLGSAANFAEYFQAIAAGARNPPGRIRHWTPETSPGVLYGVHLFYRELLDLTLHQSTYLSLGQST